jgi:hypothetical protein
MKTHAFAHPTLYPAKSLPGEPRDMFVLAEEYTYTWQDDDGHWHRLTVPKWFRTDLASVPRWLWSLSGIPPAGLHSAAAVLHDFLYHHGGVLPLGSYQALDGEWQDDPSVWTRNAADRLFLRVLKEAGVSAFRRFKMYHAVNAFGWAFWRK